MTIENPASRIDVMTDNSIQARMKENRHIMCQIVRAVIFLAKQGLPFRGDVVLLCGKLVGHHMMKLFSPQTINQLPILKINIMRKYVINFSV